MRLNSVFGNSFIRLCFVGALLCASTSAHAFQRDPDIERLLGWLEGTFSTVEQSLHDTTVHGHHLRVRRCLWTEPKTDWLYAEFIDTTTGAPFRQEFWRIRTVEHGLIEHAMFVPRAPERFRGATIDTTLLDGVDVAKDLVLRRGCEVYYQIGDRFYYGRTTGLACPSSWPGATTVILTLSPKEHWIEMHERHIDSMGQDVNNRSNPIFYMKRAIVAGD